MRYTAKATIDGGIVLDKVSGMVYTLDHVSMSFLRIIESHKRKADILDELAIVYNENRDRLRQDLDDFMSALHEKDLINLEDYI